MNNSYLNSAIRQFKMYQQLGEKALNTMDDKSLAWQPNEDSNSVMTIVKHLYGNMLSRWTDFRTTDGEKAWRDRDAEFDEQHTDRQGMMDMWSQGWACLFTALESITDADLESVIYIRNEGHTILEAINRQMSHYAYHVGQIVYIAKLCNTGNWQSLSIPRNASRQYNAAKFEQPKTTTHFTNEWLEKKD